MKKLLLALALLGFAAVGFTTASAQHYNTMYGSAYTTTYPGYSYQYSYGAGVGSYTIGCTTYYYNTVSGAPLGQQNICTNYTYPTQTSYTYPATSYTYPTTQYTYPSHTYPTYTNTNYNYTYPSNQYCTYGYQNGTWTQCASYGSVFTNTNTNYYTNPGYNNYLNCYYDQYGQYICY